MSPLETLARAMFEHEWKDLPTTDEWERDRTYWIDAAKAALYALRKIAQKTNQPESVDLFLEAVEAGD